MVETNIGKIKIKLPFWFGVAIIILLVIGFFVKIKVDSGINFVTYDSLLGIIIFHNPFVLGLYILISVVLIVTGLKRK